MEHAPERMRVVMEAPPCAAGIAQVSAVTIVAEVGQLFRFAIPRQLMGYRCRSCRGYAAAEASGAGERIGRICLPLVVLAGHGFPPHTALGFDPSVAPLEGK